MALQLLPSWLVLVVAVYFTVGHVNADNCTDAGSVHPELNATDVCILCVTTETSPGSKKNCTYELTGISGGSPCVATPKEGDFSTGIATNETQCREKIVPAPTTTTPPPPTTPPTTPPATTTPTTVTTSTTTTPTTVTTQSTTTGTTSTTTLKPPTTTSPGPTTTSTPTTAKPTPAPSGGGINWGSFFGGIAFTAGVSSVAYVVWRFYKARTERNYHTLSANLI